MQKTAKNQEDAALENMREGNDIYRKVRNYIRENRMIAPGDVIVAGISGGGDSVALLSLLCRYRRETPFSLFAVHVHHGIRGAEADRDQAFVEDLCKKCGIPCTVYAYDVPKLAKEWGMGHEEAGRLVRREAFAKELLCREAKAQKAKAQKAKAQEARVQEADAAATQMPEPDSRGTQRPKTPAGSRIALAHNQNDAAETLLFNLCRGCGLKGLSAMRPVSGKIIRPVLCLEKEEIGNYLKGEKLPFMTDSTNGREDYTRNRIRKNILPLLAEQVNPEAVRHIARAAQLLAQAQDYVDCKSAALLEDAASWEEGGAVFLSDAYFDAEPALVSDGILEILYRISGRRRDFTQAHVEAVRELCEKQTGRRIRLPYGLSAERTYGGIRIFHPEHSPKEVPGVLKTKIFPYKGQKIEEKKYTKWLDCDKITSGLVLRGRREGDFLVINEAGDKKKLNRYLIDEKIPRALRDRIPLAAQGCEILWVVGYRISEKYKITPGTKNILELRYEAEDCSTPESCHTKEETQDE